MEFLMDRIETRYGGGAQAWSLVSNSYLHTLGIDWGKACVERRVEACNGDNRDAQYVTAFPLVQLDRASKVLWLLGVNHVRTGTASYVNVALVDALQRQGIQAFDDSELSGSAYEFMVGGPYEHLSPYLFAVRFSRSCEGLQHCKEVPIEGARSLSLGRPALIILRAYVNPRTGVGPDVDSLLNFRTVTITPLQDARPRDSFDRNDPQALLDSPCTDHLYRSTLCASGAATECCEAVGMWNADACWCDSAGTALLGALPVGVGAAAMAGAARICNQRSNVTCVR